ncbi:transposase [Chitinispirillum alkaliphilum]|nr:transposase [Chitinispirillum alkaliphilum]
MTADFEGGYITSDAGLLLLRSLSKRAGLIDNAAGSIRDRRHSSYIDHTIKTLLNQRIMQIALGYYHSLDCNRMRDDVALKIACDKSNKKPLSSQSTMSRLENSLSRTDLYRLSLAICNQFTASLQEATQKIILDIDDTCDPTHGAQQLSIFNAFDNTYCYRPLHIYEGKTGKLVTAVLRPGKRPSGTEARSILKRVIKEIRSRWPKVKILIRGDSPDAAVVS